MPPVITPPHMRWKRKKLLAELALLGIKEKIFGLTDAEKERVKEIRRQLLIVF